MRINQTEDVMSPRAVELVLAAVIAAAVVYFWGPSGSGFHRGEKVRVARSGNYLATSDGGPAYLPAEGWNRFRIRENMDDGWVKIQSDTLGLVRYVESKNLRKGWMTSDRYIEKYEKNEITRLERQQATAEARVRIPTAAELKAGGVGTN
ncbi:hypothetical protein A5904_10100 [Acidithiobacillus caldus]|nr:hypothetical protein [Acidithiobacillus caldus]AUW33202.2 hypothetical protein A5904_10100 [Acidithiobacillus caldus]